MSVGVNIKYGSQPRLITLVMEFLGHRPESTRTRSPKKFCTKAGAPQNNTAADNPAALGDVCVDTTNSDVYVCTAYTTDASATTWIKITP